MLIVYVHSFVCDLAVYVNVILNRFDPRLMWMTELFVIHCESVGHHPVLHPGECFEYMSGTDLNTMHGTMCGYFNMALVKKGTSYGQVGDSLDAFDLAEEFIFKLPVEPFQLAATNA